MQTAHTADWHRRIIAYLEEHIAYLEGPTKRYRTHAARMRAKASTDAARVSIARHRDEIERLETPTS